MDDFETIKITDFCEKLRKQSSYKTLDYISIDELFNNGKSVPESDVYSIANIIVLLYYTLENNEMPGEAPPFFQKHKQAIDEFEPYAPKKSLTILEQKLEDLDDIICIPN